MYDKKRLCGAKFALLDCSGCHVATGVTNACGELEFDCLPLGKYFIKELQAPCGYEKCDDVCEVLLTADCCSRTAEFTNIRRLGSIKVIKWGCDIPCKREDH